MKYKQILSITILSLSTVGCAMTSGFQTHELPEEDGVFTTDLGTPISLIKVTQETLPAVQPAQIAYSRDYAFLFQNKIDFFTKTIDITEYNTILYSGETDES